MTAAVHTPVPLHHRKYGAKDPRRRLVGWAVVALVHAIVLWAFVTGTAPERSRVVSKPMEAAVIQEVIIPPPPPPAPPPPAPRQITPPPRPPRVQAPPPPPFVPPAEVAPPATAPAMPSTPTPPPAPPPIAAPPAAPAPAAPAGQQDIGVVCPVRVTPKMPTQAIKQGIEGVVQTEVIVRAGKVVDVKILSGPRIFHNAVRDALMQYECVSGPNDVRVTASFLFKFE